MIDRSYFDGEAALDASSKSDLYGSAVEVVDISIIAF